MHSSSISSETRPIQLTLLYLKGKVVISSAVDMGTCSSTTAAPAAANSGPAAVKAAAVT